MARSLLEAFNEDFNREIKNARSYPDAFWRAKDSFEKRYDIEPFPSYDSYRMRMQRKNKKR